MTGIRLRPRVWESKRGFYLVVIIALAVKFVLAVTTVLGHDYVDYLGLAIRNIPDVSWSPWVLYVRSVYNFWLSLPVSQGGSTSTWVISPSAMLLAALVKWPIVLSDVLSGLLLYGICKPLLNTETLARLIAVLWLINPLPSLLGEMSGSIDIILICLTLGSLYFLLGSRRLLAAFALILGIALRLSPIAVWPVFAIWVFRNRSHTKGDFAVGLAGPLGLCGYLFWLTKGALNSVLDLQLWSVLGFLPYLPTGLSYSTVTQVFDPYIGVPVLFGYVGVVVVTLVAVYLLSMESWPMGPWGAIYLMSVGFLLLLGLAVWQASAFLWVLPYLLLSYARNKNTRPYLALYHIAVGASLIAFFGIELTSGGGSFLFLPRDVVPYADSLIPVLQEMSLMLAPIFWLVRSLVVGFLLAYSLLLFWQGLGERST